MRARHSWDFLISMSASTCNRNRSKAFAGEHSARAPTQSKDAAKEKIRDRRWFRRFELYHPRGGMNPLAKRKLASAHLGQS
jgi:hypothetical protein